MLPEYPKLEAEICEEIDENFESADWAIWYKKRINLCEKLGVATFWFKDNSLENTENFPAPEALAQEIVKQSEVALEEFRSVEKVFAGNGAKV